MNKTVKTFNVSENILRVVCSVDEQVKAPYLVKLAEDYQGPCLVEADGQEQCKVTAGGEVLFEQAGFTMEPKEIYRYTFEGESPIIVTEKTVDGERSFVKNAKTIKVGDSYEAKIQFKIQPDEAIYGLGQHEDGVLNYRNATEYLYHNNMKIPMPVFLSSNNYGIFFDCASMMVYEEKDNVITVTLDAADQIDYYVIHGNCFDDLIAGIRKLTGAAVMLPKWAFGYVQSKERYKTQDEILEVAEEFAKREIPVGCLVLDWLSWEDGKWGNMYFDKKRFPDAKTMVDELHEKGIAFMISVWPSRKEGCENHTEFAKAGKLLCNNSTYDAFDEEAREMYWKMAERELFAAGTDAWWCDSTEPFTPDWNGLEKRPEKVRYEMAKESTNQYLDARNSNAYPLVHSQGIYEHQRAACDTKRVCNLTRSGYSGTQAYGTILWSGDIAATWQVYRNQIAEGLSMAMSGIPYWTLDAGAFFAGNTESWKRWANMTEGTAPWFWHGDYEDGVKDLGYCELYTRWLQLAAFLPIMRSHGTDTPREPWQFGDKGNPFYESIVKYIKLRYTLLPYTYSLAAQVWSDDYTMMRSLMFDYAHDSRVKDIKDEYMFGPAFLVAPVMEAYEYGPNSTPLNKEAKREVYLPEGNSWFDYDTKEVFQGGQTVVKDASIDTMPLYVRAGAMIPMASEIPAQTAADMSREMVDTVEIYAGDHGMFVLYVDNGMDYSYESGECANVLMIWNNDERTFTMCDKVGEYQVPDTFTVRLVKEDGTTEEKTVAYHGQEVVVAF